MAVVDLLIKILQGRGQIESCDLTTLARRLGLEEEVLASRCKELGGVFNANSDDIEGYGHGLIKLVLSTEGMRELTEFLRVDDFGQNSRAFAIAELKRSLCALDSNTRESLNLASLVRNSICIGVRIGNGSENGDTLELGSNQSLAEIVDRQAKVINEQNRRAEECRQEVITMATNEFRELGFPQEVAASLAKIVARRATQLRFISDASTYEDLKAECWQQTDKLSELLSEALKLGTVNYGNHGFLQTSYPHVIVGGVLVSWRDLSPDKVVNAVKSSQPASWGGLDAREFYTQNPNIGPPLSEDALNYLQGAFYGAEGEVSVKYQGRGEDSATFTLSPADNGVFELQIQHGGGIFRRHSGCYAAACQLRGVLDKDFYYRVENTLIPACAHQLEFWIRVQLARASSEIPCVQQTDSASGPAGCGKSAQLAILLGDDFNPEALEVFKKELSELSPINGLSFFGRWTDLINKLHIFQECDDPVINEYFKEFLGS
jgi:hypothetical protein